MTRPHDNGTLTGKTVLIERVVGMAKTPSGTAAGTAAGADGHR